MQGIKVVKVILLLLLLNITTISINAKVDYATENNNTATKHYTQDNKLIKEAINLQSSDQQTVIDFDSIKKITVPSDLTPGYATATKQSSFVNSSDAYQGIVKTQVDAFGKELESGSDTIFALDVSGSMNTYRKGNGHPTSTHAVISDSVYYCTYKMFDTTATCDSEDQFIKAKEFMGQRWTKFNCSLKGFKNSIWTKMKREVEPKAIDNNEITAWLPQQNLYRMIENNGEKTFEKINDRSDEIPNKYEYYSPSYDKDLNPDGLLDRMMIQNQSVYNVIKKVLASNKNNRVGLILYSGSVIHEVKLTSDMTQFEILNKDGFGYSGTSYEKALESTYKQFQNSANDRIKNLIFMSDGDPYPNNQNYQQYLTKLDTLEVNRFSFGIYYSKEGTVDHLARVASNENQYYNSFSQEAVEEALSQILEKITLNPEIKYEEVLNEEYDLIIDENHPFILKNKYEDSTISFNSIKELNDSKLAFYDETTKTLNVEAIIVELDGIQLSYYTKLQDEYLDKDINKPIAKSSKAKYKKVINNHGLPELESEFNEQIIFDTNYINQESGKLEIELTSDKMHEQDQSLLGQEVSFYELINYTITLKNSGPLNFNQIMIEKLIPDFTSENNKLKQIKLENISIKANENYIYNYQVIVDEYSNKYIYNQARAIRDVNKSLSIKSNSLENPIKQITTNPPTVPPIDPPVEPPVTPPTNNNNNSNNNSNSNSNSNSSNNNTEKDKNNNQNSSTQEVEKQNGDNKVNNKKNNSTQAKAQLPHTSMTSQLILLGLVFSIVLILIYKHNYLK